MPASTKKRTIELTKKQFLSLMKTVYLGNWMANAFRTDDKQEDYEQAEDIIFSYASRFGYEKYVDHESIDGNKYYPTGYFEMETDVHDLRDEYEEESFWEELAQRLAFRDLSEKYSKDELQAMSREEFFLHLHVCEDVYNKEFETLGVERLRLKK